MADRKPVGCNALDTDIVLSVVTSCYNTRGILADCLRSIYQNPPNDPYEIIVVDDASIDGTHEMVRTEFPEVCLLRNEINRHCTVSNIRAFNQARGQYLLLLNDDTIVLPGALEQMITFLREHPEAGAVGCKLLNEDGSIQYSAKLLPRPSSAVFGGRSIVTKLFPNNRYSRQHLLNIDQNTAHPVVADDAYLSTAALMVPRPVYDKVGSLDDRLVYHVDADYCKRISDAGYKCYYLPTATIMHLNHRGGTMASLRARVRSLVMFEVQSYIYYRKHAQNPAWSPMPLLVATGLFCHFLALSAGQAYAVVGEVARSRSQPKRSAG